MTTDPHRRVRDAIAAHFAGSSVPVREQEMRAHLPRCAPCHQHYERHLLLSSLDPAGLSSEARLARGLGFQAGGQRPGRMTFGLLGFCGAAFAALVMVYTGNGPWRRGAPRQVAHEGPHEASDEAPGSASIQRQAVVSNEASDEGVVPRGARGAQVVARMPEVQIYRIRTARPGRMAGNATGELPVRAFETVHRDDELAFLYRNPGGKTRLLVFAVDEHGHVYWYHPGWSDAGENPTAVPISSEPGLHELPASVLHKFDGEHIMIHALFTDRELTVRQVEAAVAAAATRDHTPGAPSPLALPGATDVVRPLRVLR